MDSTKNFCMPKQYPMGAVLESHVHIVASMHEHLREVSDHHKEELWQLQQQYEITCQLLLDLKRNIVNQGYGAWNHNAEPHGLDVVTTSMEGVTLFTQRKIFARLSKEYFLDGEIVKEWEGK